MRNLVVRLSMTLPLAVASTLSSRMTELVFDPTEPLWPNSSGTGVMGVGVGLYLERLRKMDDVKQLFDAEVYVTFTWRDPRPYSPLFRGDLLARHDEAGRQFIEFDRLPRACCGFLRSACATSTPRTSV
jgi:hypothetical protein